MKQEPVDVRSSSWMWINLLSLDAPLVAVTWQIFCSRAFRVPFDARFAGALGLAVWIIYVTDRLFDAVRTSGDMLAARHRFSRLRWKQLAAAALVGSLLLARICARLPAPVLINGLLLSFAVACYFGMVHLASPKFCQHWPKELAVGTIFSLGMWLPTWTSNPAERSLMAAPAVLFAALCTLNCMAIEFWEWNAYHSHQNSYQKPYEGSYESAAPHRLTRWAGSAMPALTAALAVLAALCFAFAPDALRPIFLASFLSSAALFALASLRHRVSVELRRVLADAALLTPIIFLLPFGAL